MRETVGFAGLLEEGGAASGATMTRDAG